jgi:hypothetical protein
VAHMVRGSGSHGKRPELKALAWLLSMVVAGSKVPGLHEHLLFLIY